MDIDDDLLLAVREIAQQRKTTVGSVVSGPLRESLLPSKFTLEYRNGLPLLPRRPNSPVVTAKLVNRLGSEDE